MTKISDQTVTGPQLGEILNITARRVRQLAEEGIFERVGRGRYSLVASIQAYIATIEARADGEDLRAERIALLRAQTRRVQLDNARKETTDRDVDEQEAAVSTFARHLLLRLRPLGDWLFQELQDRGHTDAREVAGTAVNWIIGDRAEIEAEVLTALAEARRRGVMISSNDDLLKMIGRNSRSKKLSATSCKASDCRNRCRRG